MHQKEKNEETWTTKRRRKRTVESANHNTLLTTNLIFYADVWKCPYYLFPNCATISWVPQTNSPYSLFVVQKPDQRPVLYCAFRRKGFCDEVRVIWHHQYHSCAIFDVFIKIDSYIDFPVPASSVILLLYEVA